MNNNQSWEFPLNMWLTKTHLSRRILYSPTPEPYYSIDSFMKELKTGDLLAFEGASGVRGKQISG